VEAEHEGCQRQEADAADRYVVHGRQNTGKKREQLNHLGRVPKYEIECREAVEFLTGLTVIRRGEVLQKELVGTMMPFQENHQEMVCNSSR